MVFPTALLRLLGAAFIAATTPVASQASSADPAPLVRVIDGDTLAIGDRRVRLHGIDAAEGA